ncbi:hypothetical protein LQW54_005089 [Pestalotiopsis sp. IQ-011]
MSGKIIVTAKGADTKVLNRLLLHVRDWEFGEEDEWDRQRLLRTRDEATAKDLEEDVPPLPAGGLENQWEGLSMEEVEKIMRLKDNKSGRTSLFMVLDDQGVRDETLVVVQRAIDWESEDSPYLDDYNKVRVPWQEVHSMWCNLDIANMSFEEFCLGEDPPEDYWWTYKPIEEKGHYDEYTEERDATIKELEKLGQA